MDPISLIAGPLLGMGVGALKDLAEKPARDRANQLAADTQRLAPWTGLKAAAPEKHSTFGDVLQGGMAGLQVGQGISKMAAGTPPQIGPPTQAQAQVAGSAGPVGWLSNIGKAFSG